ncbi:hypothetical protein AAFF_G00120780 [Aldrovandia affinis]|uniref:Uncharacterized protein n=1 Tax=Aldrovandia affinis TaxID=143900 RepID=A0AAD7WAF4_9TELE|nr:hypothetical protein AAFF_G00120780 [Aldrovandia affinis]
MPAIHTRTWGERRGSGYVLPVYHSWLKARPEPSAPLCCPTASEDWAFWSRVPKARLGRDQQACSLHGWFDRSDRQDRPPMGHQNEPVGPGPGLSSTIRTSPVGASQVV